MLITPQNWILNGLIKQRTCIEYKLEIITNKSRPPMININKKKGGSIKSNKNKAWQVFHVNR